MQLIEYSAQSKDLAAPLKCRQLYIQREYQRQRSFQLLLKSKVVASLQHEVQVTYKKEIHNALKCSILCIPHKVMI